MSDAEPRDAGATQPGPSDAERALALLGAHPAARAMGVTLVEAAPGRATLRMVVVDSMVNAHDICHGGVVFAVADLACSIAAGSTVAGSVARGASIELLNPAPMGSVLEASASVTYLRGRGGIVDAAVITAEGTHIALLRDRIGAPPPAVPGSDG